MRVRPLAATDADAVRDIVGATLPYLALSRWALETALAARSDEARALVALDEHEQPIGLASFGPVGGAQGTARILGVATRADSRARDVAGALIDAVVVDLRRAGTRLVVAELPDDPSWLPLHRLLLDRGFREAGRVPDYFRDGVSLVILRRALEG